MFAPSKARAKGCAPAAKVPSTCPSLALNLVTVLSAQFATQTSAPSKATARGSFPTAKVPRAEPSLARSLVTELPWKFVTQMFAPSKAAPVGLLPTAKVPSVVPSLARSLVTLLPSLFTTQMLAPSKATATGPLPTGNCVVTLASYQCRMATWSGFLVESTTPFCCARVGTDNNDRAKTLRTTQRSGFDPMLRLTQRTLCSPP